MDNFYRIFFLSNHIHSLSILSQLYHFMSLILYRHGFSFYDFYSLFNNYIAISAKCLIDTTTNIYINHTTFCITIYNTYMLLRRACWLADVCMVKQSGLDLKVDALASRPVALLRWFGDTNEFAGGKQASRGGARSPLPLPPDRVPPTSPGLGTVALPEIRAGSPINHILLHYTSHRDTSYTLIFKLYKCY